MPDVVAGWCPTCGSEWWVTTSTCPDCGTTLTAERPESAPVAVDETGTPIAPRDHELREFDLDHLTDAERWELWVRLDSAGIAHEWVGGTLRGPVEATEIVDAFLADDAEDPSPAEAGQRPSSAIDDEGVERAPSTPRLARLGGALIDYLLLGIVAAIVSALWHTTTHATTNGVSTTVTRTTTGAALLLLGLRVAYDIVGVGAFGTTVGKRIFRLRVIAATGERAGWRRAIVRYVAVALTVAPTYGPHSWGHAAAWASLGLLIALYLPILFDPLARGLHDRAARTVVVRAS